MHTARTRATAPGSARCEGGRKGGRESRGVAVVAGRPSLGSASPIVWFPSSVALNPACLCPSHPIRPSSPAGMATRTAALLRTCGTWCTTPPCCTPATKCWVRRGDGLVGWGGCGCRVGWAGGGRSFGGLVQLPARLSRMNWRPAPSRLRPRRAAQGAALRPAVAGARHAVLV